MFGVGSVFCIEGIGVKGVFEVVERWGGKRVEGEVLVFEFKTQRDAMCVSVELSDLGFVTVKLDRVVSLI